jgi:MFS family permease
MLQPVSRISAAELEAGQQALVRDLAWASLSSAFCGGVILTAFALTIGATPIVIGLLAAIPFFTQALQLPATVLVERQRRRKLLAFGTNTAARVLVLAMAALPFLPGHLALSALVAAQFAICAFVAVGGCAMNSWMHELIPQASLGSFFARRLFWGTTVACVGTLAAGALLDHIAPHRTSLAYATCFAIAGLAGFASSSFVARAPEPQMRDAGPRRPMRERLRAPFRDPNFRRLLIFLGSWIVASNLAAPFFTVFLINQLEYPVGTVTTLWVSMQFANALTLYLWGRLSDRLTNKAVLAVALPAYFTCLLALCFVDNAPGPRSQLAILYLLHVVMGVASGGIGLATGNLGLKLAPQGEGTTYLAAIGLVSAAAGGIAPIAAGTLAELFKLAKLSAVIRFSTPWTAHELSIMTFAHWEFVFTIAAALGLYVLHALSRVNEGHEVSERQIMQEFAIEAWRSIGSIGSSTLGAVFPFERLSERRKWWRMRGER